MGWWWWWWCSTECGTSELSFQPLTGTTVPVNWVVNLKHKWSDNFLKGRGRNNENHGNTCECVSEHVHKSTGVCVCSNGSLLVYH